MNEREYRRLRRQIEDEYRKKIEALDLVWQMTTGSSNGVPTDDDANPVKRGAIDAAVRKVLPKLTGDFGWRQVRERVEKAEPALAGQVNRSTVSSALRRLADEGLITFVQHGKGRRPTRYRVKGASLNPSDFVAEPEVEIEPEPLPEPEPELTDDDIPF